MSKIILILMIKNEEVIIERCINSAMPIIDGVCICDTGSTDNTLQTIKNLLNKSDKPYKITHCNFKNFGYNRTKSFEFTREFINELGWDSSTTFGLLLDADMILKVNPSFNTSIIENYDTCYILQQKRDINYYNIRIIRMNLDWECEGKTHEEWICKSTHKIIKIENKYIWIEDVDDGGCKKDTFERDLRFLLEETPKDAKTYFYLGQTYFALNDRYNSIIFYKKCIEIIDICENAYIAYLFLIRNYIILVQQNIDIDQNIQLIEQYTSDAQSIYPIRSEIYSELVDLFTNIKYYDKAWKYLNIGIDIQPPKDQYAYYNEITYTHGFLFKKAQLLLIQHPEKIRDIFLIFSELIDKKKDDTLNSIFLENIKKFCCEKLKVNIENNDLIPDYKYHIVFNGLSLINNFKNRIFYYFNNYTPGVIYNKRTWLLLTCDVMNIHMHMFLILNEDGKSEFYYPPFILDNGAILKFEVKEDKGFLFYQNKIASFDISILDKDLMKL